MKKKNLILLLSAIVLLFILIFSLYQIVQAQKQYQEEAAAYDALLVYRPEIPGEISGSSESSSPIPSGSGASGPSVSPAESESLPDPAVPILNHSIIQLRSDHPNAIGWISIPGTNIDYPFVQGPDNDYFLRRDLDGNYLYAGVPFLDYRCDPSFDGDNTILYGHNLRNGTMFGALEKFRDTAFLTSNREVFVFLENKTIRASVVACLVIDPDEKNYVYSLQPEADHLLSLWKDARACVPEEFPQGVRYLTLSTCGYEFDGARIALVAVIRD